MAMKRFGKLLIILNKCPIDFEGRTSKVKVTKGSKHPKFSPILSFPDHNSSLKSAIAMNRYGKLLIILNWCSINYEGRKSKVRVTRGQNVSNLARFCRFRIITHVPNPL